jgi:hypothetical protein
MKMTLTKKITLRAESHRRERRGVAGKDARAGVNHGERVETGEQGGKSVAVGGRSGSKCGKWRPASAAHGLI